jgi:hypothetical protein
VGPEQQASYVLSGLKTISRKLLLHKANVTSLGGSCTCDGGGENKEQIREEMWGEEEKKTWTRLRRERGIR